MYPEERAGLRGRSRVGCGRQIHCLDLTGKLAVGNSKVDGHRLPASPTLTFERKAQEERPEVLQPDTAAAAARDWGS